MTSTTTPIANRLGLNRGWINPTAPSILLNTKDTSAMQFQLLYLKSYLLIKEYLRFQQINLIAFDIKAASPYKKIIYLSIYQHMLYDYKEHLYTELKFLWFDKQTLQKRYCYKSNIMYNFNIIKTIKNNGKIKDVLWPNWSKYRFTIIKRRFWSQLQIRYYRRNTKTWNRRWRGLKFRSYKRIIKSQLKNKIKINKWKYRFVQKPIIFKKSLKRLKVKKYRRRQLYIIRKTAKLKKDFTKHSIKKLRKLKKYRKNAFRAINKKTRHFWKFIAPHISKKSKRSVFHYYFKRFFDESEQSWLFKKYDKIYQNKNLRNILNVKHLKTHLKIFFEIFFKNWLGIDSMVKINHPSKNVYIKKAIAGLSTVNLELKRINKLDYFKRLAYVIITAHKNQAPQVIADIIAREVELTREFKRFCHNIDLIFSAFMPGSLNSYRIVISGKTNPRDLRRDWEIIKYQNKDGIPRKQFNKRVLYALGVARNNRGQFGIKVWLYY